MGKNMKHLRALFSEIPEDKLKAAVDEVIRKNV